MRRALPLLVCIVGEITAVVALHRLGNEPGMSIPLHDLGSWLRESNPEDAVTATLRLVALAGAWCQLVATVGYTAARLARAPRAITALGPRMLLPLVRSCADRALVISVVAGAALTSTGGTAVAAPDPPSPGPRAVEVRSGRAAPLPVTAPVPPRAPLPPTAPVPPIAPLSPTAPLSAVHLHTVVAGDSLWTIASARVAQSTGRPTERLTEAEIASYWVRVCDANRARVRSGDVDLIVPGETIVLPPA